MEKEKLKTLNEISGLSKMHCYEMDLVHRDDIRKEAIKWIKSDLEDLKYCKRKDTSEEIIGKWISRLDLTEEELK